MFISFALIGFKMFIICFNESCYSHEAIIKGTNVDKHNVLAGNIDLRISGG